MPFLPVGATLCETLFELRSTLCEALFESSCGLCPPGYCPAQRVLREADTAPIRGAKAGLPLQYYRYYFVSIKIIFDFLASVLK